MTAANRKRLSIKVMTVMTLLIYDLKRVLLAHAIFTVRHATLLRIWD